MIDMYHGNIPILDEHSPEARDMMHLPQFGKGYVPRDYSIYPQEMFQSPSEMTLIPESEWDARYDEQEKEQSSLEHLYLSGPGGTPVFEHIEQNGHGYCWAYSVGHCIMVKRMANNLPYIRINPHATAAIIKNGRDEGGWCGLSCKFGREVGYAVEGTGPGQWPLHSRDLRHDTPALRAEMAKHKIMEDWVDLTKDVYDQTMNRLQFATALQNNDPCAHDNMDWAHSVCGIRWARIERGSWGPLILNSWKGWGRFGLAVLRGGQARIDGAVSLRVTGASAN